MQFNVREVAGMFQVPESQVFRWIAEDHLPAIKINGQYRFNRSDLLEWATIRRLNITSEMFEGTPVGSSARLGLSEALEAGAIVHGLSGADKPAVLRAVVESLPLPEGFDRESLLQLFLSREAVGSTGLGEGIAIPHPRHPVILPVGRPVLAIMFLERAIDFGSLDRRPVDTLFVLISPTIRMHLQMLARVSCLIRDEAFRGVLKRRGAREEILREVQRVESTFDRVPAARESETA